ncbi:MAG: VOC family protein [Ahrensia sp.]|nr:VOC family protein [Ahrensia sp.]
MSKALLEHVNITVSNAEKTAQTLCDMFDWHIRWQGAAMNGIGRTVHVGTEDGYVALYSPNAGSEAPSGNNYEQHGALNHIGVVVGDIAEAEERVKQAGYEPRSHADYEPGKRFYFDGDDGIEVEVVSYE